MLLVIASKAFWTFSSINFKNFFSFYVRVFAKNMLAFSVVLCGANETLEVSLGGGSSSRILFLVENKCRTEISPKTAKISM